MSPSNEEPKNTVEDMPEAEKRRAIDAAKAVKDAVADTSIGLAAPNPDEATGSSAPGKTAFDKALEAAQQQGAHESHDYGKDI